MTTDDLDDEYRRAKADLQAERAWLHARLDEELLACACHALVSPEVRASGHAQIDAQFDVMASRLDDDHACCANHLGLMPFH